MGGICCAEHSLALVESQRNDELIQVRKEKGAVFVTDDGLVRHLYHVFKVQVT